MVDLLGLPDLASEHGGRLDAMLAWMHVVMVVLFVGWGAFFAYLLVRFRKSRNPVANYEGSQSHASSWLEGLVVVLEVVFLFGFSFPLWAERVRDFPPASEAVQVRLVGEQFAWNVHYPGPDGVFGKTSVDAIDLAGNPLGLVKGDPAGADDIVTVNQLHLPVGKPALISLRSKDVIHCLALQEMRVKQDAVPGIDTPVWFVPTVTTAEMREKKGKPTYNYEIACAQLCGLGHYRMRGFLTIHEPGGFETWLAQQKPALGS